MDARPFLYSGRRRASRRRPGTPPVLAPAPTIPLPMPVRACPVYNLVRCPCHPRSPR